MFVYHSWPAYTCYGRGYNILGQPIPIEYTCHSFFGYGNGPRKLGFYKLLVQVHDKAYAIFNAGNESNGGLPVFLDPSFQSLAVWCLPDNLNWNSHVPGQKVLIELDLYKKSRPNYALSNS